MSKTKAEKLQDEGLKLVESRKFKEGIAKLEESLKLEPENGIFRYNLGLALYNSQDFKTAKREFLLSIRYSGLYDDPYFALASINKFLDEKWKAATFYLAYLNLQEHGLKADTARIRLSELGDNARVPNVQTWLDSVFADYDELLRHFKEGGDGIGEDILLSGPSRYHEAASKMGDILERLAPVKAKEWAFPHFNNANSLFGNKKYYAAIAQFITGIESYPYQVTAFLQLSLAYILTGVTHEALEINEYIAKKQALDTNQRFSMNAEEIQWARRITDYIKKFLV